MGERLRTVVRTALGLTAREAAALSDQDSVYTIPRWDSLGHVRLMAALEQEYRVSIPDAETIRLITISALTQFVKDHEAAEPGAGRLERRAA